MTKRTHHFQNCLGVFQGGGVKAIAYAGAYEEAIERKVFFSQLVGASAGSIIAVLISAGAQPDQLYKILSKLDTNAFLREPVEIPGLSMPWMAKIPFPKCMKLPYYLATFSRYLGIYDGSYIRDWINDELKSLLNITRPPTFADLYIPTIVVATDLSNRKTITWGNEETLNTEVGLAVQASCSMPFFFQPVNKSHVDGGMLSNLPSFLVKPETIFDKVLAFGFKDGSSNEINSVKDYMLSLATTVVDGAVNIQRQLQQNIHTIEIDTLKVSSTDFKKIDKELIETLVSQGRVAARKFFDEEENILINSPKRQDVAVDLFESFNLLLKSMNGTALEILLCDDNPTWLYSLFPLLLNWSQNNVEVKVLLKKGAEGEHHRDYKLRLLNSLGFAVQEIENLPFRGFILNGFSQSGSAIILSDQKTPKVHSTYLEGKYHLEVIRLLREKFKSVIRIPDVKPSRIYTDQAPKITKLLKRVWQYASKEVTLNVEEVNIEKLIFLTRFVKGYKYRQVEELIKLYEQNGHKPFNPIKINFTNNKHTYVTPPIIEVHDSKFFVIEGNARILYAYKNRIAKLKVIVARGVTTSLPSSGQYSIKQILISDSLKRGEGRYKDFDKDLFRKIEETIHNPLTSLL
jgi:predicted acylesterase/phospholipase RssA